MTTATTTKSLSLADVAQTLRDLREHAHGWAITAYGHEDLRARAGTVERLAEVLSIEVSDLRRLTAAAQTLRELADGDATGLPTMPIDRVHHIGTLTLADRGRQSYEGAGLSVCWDPEHWRAVMGNHTDPVHELVKSDGRFLLASALGDAQRAAILDWGQREGLLAITGGFLTSGHDAETGRNIQTIHDSRTDAVQHLQLEETPAAPIAPVQRRIATGLLEELIDRAVTTDPADAILALWVDQHTDLDGVWWDGPNSMFGARGTISQRHLPSWTAQ